MGEGLTRQGFLRLMTATIASTLTGFEFPPRLEIEPLVLSTLFIDVPPGSSKEDFLEIVKQIDQQSFMEHAADITTLANQYFESISSHGESMLNTWHEILGSKGIQSINPEILSVLPMIRPSEYIISNEEDLETSFIIDINSVEQGIRANDQKIINLSLQLGETKVKYGYTNPKDIPIHRTMAMEDTNSHISYYYIPVGQLPLDASYQEIPYIREDGVTVMAAKYTNSSRRNSTASWPY